MRRKHKLRALRNLAVTVLCLLLIWAESGYPLPTQEMEFRRAERQMLLERSAVIWTDQALAGSRTPAMLVGEARAAFHVYGLARLTVHPRHQGGTPLVLPGDLPNEQGGWARDLAILVPDPPEGAVSARMTLSVGHLYPVPENAGDELLTYTLTGTRMDERFLLQPKRQYTLEEDSTEAQRKLWSAEHDRLRDLASFLQYHYNVTPLDETPYTLEFFDADGELVTAVTSPGK